MAAHKNFRIQFVVENRCYEATSILNEGEADIDGTEMHRRVIDGNSGAVGKKHTTFIAKHLNKLPKKLHSYCLFTSQCRPDYPCHTLCFYFYAGEWYQNWEGPDRRWCHNTLMLRHCP